MNSLSIRSPELTALFLVGVGVLLAVERGILASGVSRHIDTPWFHAAAECVTRGLSPYNVAFFRDCWSSVSEVAYKAPFVFPPVALPFTLPMSGMKPETAWLYWDLLGVAALLLLARLLWVIADASSARGSRRVMAGALVGLGVSTGGMSASHFTGQPVVLVAVGVALLVLAVLRNSPLSLVIGTFLALIKPHLVLIVVFASWLARLRTHWRALVLTGLLLSLPVVLIMTLEGHFVRDYLTAIEEHRAAESSKLLRPEILYGFAGMAGLFPSYQAFALTLLGTALASSALGWVVGRSNDRPWPALLAGVVLLSPVVFPHKGYDLAVYATVFALVARMPISTQIVLLLPLVILWRPRLAGFFGSPDSTIFILNLVVIATALFLLAHALSVGVRVRVIPPKSKGLQK